MLKLLNHKRAKISSPSKSHLPRNIEDHPRGHKSATSRFPLPKFSKFALCIQHPPLRWMLRDERRTCTYVQVCEGSAQISISGVKSGIRVAEWFHIMLQPEVRERSVQRVSLVFGGRAIRVNARANPVSAPNRRYTRTYTRTWRTPSATPRAASEQRLPVAFGSVATPLAFMDRPFSACWFVRAPPQVHENDLVCVCVFVCGWGRNWEGVPGGGVRDQNLDVHRTFVCGCSPSPYGLWQCVCCLCNSVRLFPSLYPPLSRPSSHGSLSTIRPVNSSRRRGTRSNG